MREYADGLNENGEEGNKRRWLEETYLDKPVTVNVNELGRQIVDPPGFWEDLVITQDNGFVSGFSINRNAGGSLYLGNNFDREQFTYQKLVRFSLQKLEEYSIPGEPRKIYGYSKHNVYYYQGALFLLICSILFLNEAMRVLDRKGKLE